MSQPLHGIIPPLTTPFSARGRLRLDSLERNLDRYLKTDLSGFLVLGSNGESVHLNAKERLQVVQTVVDRVQGRGSLIIGVSAASLRQALTLVEEVSQVCADALLISTPAYYKNRMTALALTDFFVEIAERATQPILLYNVPQYSGLELGVELVSRLAQHPRIIGVKDSSANLTYLQHVLAKTRGENFQLISGSAQVFAPALLLGVEAAILAVACALPQLPLALLEASKRGQDVGRLQARLFQVANVLTSEYGVPGLKCAMDLEGFEGLSCRRPLAPLSTSERQELIQVLETTMAGAR